jgi:predicted flap endonuclease-1-like 5' DNA nuclease
MLTINRSGKNLYFMSTKRTERFTVDDIVCPNDYQAVQEAPFVSEQATIELARFGLMGRGRNRQGNKPGLELHVGSHAFTFTNPDDIGSILSDFRAKYINELQDKPAALYTFERKNTPYRMPPVCMSTLPTLDARTELRDFPDSPIARLGLGTLTANVLAHKGITTIKDLCTHTRKDITKIQGMGNVCIEDLQEKLGKYGVKLAYDYSVQ